MSYLTHTYEGPDDMPAHIKAAMLPVSLQIPVVEGRLALEHGKEFTFSNIATGHRCVRCWGTWAGLDVALTKG